MQVSSQSLHVVGSNLLLPVLQKSAYLDANSLPQTVILPRSSRKRKGGKICLSVQSSLETHLPTSPLFGAMALRNKEAGKSWINNVASMPPPEIADPPEFTDELKEAVAAAPETNASEASFEWKSIWYPVFPEIDADKAVPHPFQILGRKVVIWYDKGAAKWQTFLDVCPHRLAALSEGRIDEQGCLQCCYHGWSFKGDGSCARIPQAQMEGPEAKAASKFSKQHTGEEGTIFHDRIGRTTGSEHADSTYLFTQVSSTFYVMKSGGENGNFVTVMHGKENKMAQCVSFPTMVKQGMLFVWPDENGHELAEKTPLPTIPGIDEEGWCAVCTFRDLDYGYDTGMENLVDPSHVPVAHHNVNGGMMGNRNMAAPIALEIKFVNTRGFEGQWNKPWGGPPSIHTFDAPTRFTYRFTMKGNKATASTTTYCTPIAPGRSRILVVNARNGMNHLTSGPAWWQILPRWRDHQMMLNLFDGDLTLLHAQERNLRDATGGQLEKWNKAFFMPTASDRYVGAFRQWLTRFGRKGVQYAPGVDLTLPPLVTKREDLLDRYHSHTKQCICCSKALENFKKAQTVLTVLAAVLTGVGAVLPQTLHRFVAVGCAAVCALIAWHLNGWIQMFIYKGWDHAHLD